MKNPKPSFTQLTEEQKRQYGDGCGAVAHFLNVPDFIFTASCRHHDFNYERGGSLRYKFKADWDFFKHMLADARESDHRFWYSIISFIYWMGVTLIPITYIYFDYGEWRTVDEILERDRKRKAK